MASMSSSNKPLSSTATAASSGEDPSTTNTTTNKFSDAVDRMVLRVALQEGHEGESASPPGSAAAAAASRHTKLLSHAKPAAGQGPLLPHELSELSLLCTMASSLSMSSSDDNNAPQQQQQQQDSDGLCGFASVDGDQLVALVELLDKHVNLAVANSTHLISDALELLQDLEEEGSSSPSQTAAFIDKWLKRKEGASKLMCLKLGLEAASILIFLVTSPGIDRRAMNEDAMEASITLMRLHLSKNLVPAWNQTGHLLPGKKTKSASADPKALETSPSKRRRRSNEGGASTSSYTKHLKKLYKELLSFVHLQLGLMDRMERLVRDIPLDDQQILMLTNACLLSLEIDGGGGATHHATSSSTTSKQVQQLHTVCISLVTAAFRKYPMHRETILEDLFPVLLRLPTGKRSLRTCTIRYDKSSASPASLAARNASVVGSVIAGKNSHSSNSNATTALAEPHCIQMVTAMILSLVQACVVRPMFQRIETERDGDEDDDEDLEEQDDQNSNNTRLVSGLGPCHAVSNVFVNQLVKRCARKQSEFRPVLQNLVQDLLLVLIVPEYPAAEVLLSSLIRRLSHDLSMASSSSHTTTSLETTYLNTAFDVLGKICAVEARILAVQREKALQATRDVPMDQDDDEDEIHVHCYCNSTDRDKFMIGCDHCKVFFHGSCVGCLRESIHPDSEWICDSCRLGRIVERERLKHKQSNKKNASGEDIFIDDSYALHHSHLSSLSHRAHNNDSMEDATRFHLARWIDHLEQKAASLDTEVHPSRIITELLEFWCSPGPGGEPLSEEGNNRMILSLVATTSPLLLSFRNQVRFILQLMADESSHSLRKLSLKAIEKTVEGDPKLMLLPIINKAVSLRLTDESISVREAAVSLVGSYVVQSPAVASSFQPSLLTCLTDVGVSVRKRTVRIFQEILTLNPSYKGRSAVCDAMLQRASDPKEEDAVRDLIHDLFARLWLEDGQALVPVTVGYMQKTKNGQSPAGPDSPGAGNEVGHGPGVVTPTTPASNLQSKPKTPIPQKRVDVAAEQMMEVVRKGRTSEHLEALLNKLLRGATDGEKGRKKAERKKREELGRKQCEHLVNSLFELLISVEEQRSSRSTRIGRDLAATLQTIGIFSEFAPQMVLKHLDTILPYLKADNGVSADDESSIVAASCDIISRLTSSLGQDIADRVASASVASDLVHITYKFGPSTVESAVRALSTLARHQGAGENGLFAKKLLDLSGTFYSYLCKKCDVEDFSSEVEKVRNNTHRALTALGFICQYHDARIDSDTWGNEVESEEELLQTADLAWENITFACYRIFSKYLVKVDDATKCAALRAFCCMFMAQPRLMLMLEQIGLIEAVMSEEAHEELQLVSLQSWHKILSVEEKRIDGGKADAEMECDEHITVSKRIAGDQDGDATLFGGVSTNHADRLFEMTQSKDRKIRFASVELLGLLLRQGLVNPNETVPFLFALQGDIGNGSVRSLALRLLMFEGEKRPDMLRQRICAGVKQAFSFQRRMYPDKPVSALVDVRCGSSSKVDCVFSSVFKECIASSRKQRHGLFSNLLSLFELDEVEDVDEHVLSPRRRKRSKRSNSTDLFLLSYVSQILAHLPYSVAGDPLFIINKIGSIVTLQGAQILERLASLLRPFGLSSSDEYDEANASEDALERAARSKFPSRTQEARPLSSREFDLSGFAELCQKGAALILLLRLKSFLRRLYNLSEARCLEYDPNMKEKVAEKAISRSDSKPFDSAIGGVNRRGGIDKDGLIRQYAELRMLLREETSFESKNSGSGASGSEEEPNEESTGRKRSADDL